MIRFASSRPAQVALAALQDRLPQGLPTDRPIVEGLRRLPPFERDQRIPTGMRPSWCAEDKRRKLAQTQASYAVSFVTRAFCGQRGRRCPFWKHSKQMSGTRRSLS